MMLDRMQAANFPHWEVQANQMPIPIVPKIEAANMA